MASSLEERLRLVVDATTGTAETAFDKLTGSAKDAARASDDAATSVGNAADAVAQARAREADAAGKLSIAEAKLNETRARYGEDSSQVVAAEERVASAQRQVQLASARTADALETQEDAQRKATSTTEKATTANEEAGRGAEKYREQVSELRNMVIGFVAGASLADWLSESFTGYVENARAAGQLATAMNATTEQGGQLVTLFGSLGLEMDDILEIQASFAQVLGAQPKLLDSIGASVKKNADGTTNWALTLEDTLSQLQKIPDATQRNQLGFQLFGEEGYKQLSRLLLSGKSVSEALAQIGTPFDDSDVEAARRFDAAMLDLKTTGGGLARDVGGTLVPIVTTLLNAFQTTADVVGQVPGPMLLAAAAAVVLGLAQSSAAAEGGLLAGVLAGLEGRTLSFRTAAAEAAVSTTLLGRGVGAARVAGGGLVSMLGGPLGLAILGITAGFTLLNSLTGSNSEQSQRAKQSQQDLAAALKESNGVITENVRQQAAQTAQESGMLSLGNRIGIQRGQITEALLGNKDAYDKARKAAEDYIDASLTSEHAGDPEWTKNAEDARKFVKSLDDLRDSTNENATAQTELAGELGQSTDKAALATAANDALTAAIDAGQASGEAFATTVKTAADAQDDQSRSSDLAKAAIDAYHASTDGAVQSTLDLFSAQLSLSDQHIAVQKAFAELHKTVDDTSTSWDEVTEAQNKAIETVLSYGKSSGDAAVSAAKASGQIVDAAAEAQIRAQATVDALRSSLDEPGLTDAARDQIQQMIDKLTDAQSKGDITAVLSLTGVPEVEQQTAAATADQTTTVDLETRGGPAVISYIDKIVNADRLALIKVESRGGPAVVDYLGSVAGADRLSIIRVESRNGPVVSAYIDGLAADRLAIIRVETRGGPAVEDYLNRLARDRTTTVNAARGSGGVRGAGAYGAPAVGDAGSLGRVMLGSVTLDLELTGTADRTQLSSAQRGAATVRDVKAYERENGTGWRKGSGS